MRTQKKEGGIVHIKNLFSKYTKVLTVPPKTIIQTFITIVSDTVGVTLTTTHCSYSTTTRTINLTVSGVVKTEILFKKQEILTQLTDVFTKQHAPVDIR